MRFLVAVIAVIAVAAIGGFVTAPVTDGDWYLGLAKPAWQPPGNWFGIVWPILYVLMTIGYIMGAIRASTQEQSRALNFAFYGQLAFNLAWSLVFFGARSLWGGMFVIGCLWLSILVFIRSLWPISRAAAWMQLPYLLWVTFAATLNGFIALNN